MKILTLRRLAFAIILLLGTTTFTSYTSIVVQAQQPSGAQEAAQPSPTRPQAGGAQALLDQGQELIRTRQFDEAVEVLRRAVQTQPGSTLAHIQLGMALLYLGRAQEALGEMNQAQQLSPNDPHVYVGMGNANGALRRYPEAIEAYRQAILLNPDYFAAYIDLGIIYGTTNRFSESGEAFKQALRIEPQNADAHNGMAIALYRTGHPEEGIAELKKAIQLRPNFVNAYLNLARWYNDLGRYKEAAEAFTPVTRIVPRFPTTYFERSVDYMYLGRGEDAANDARTFLEINDWHRDRAPYMVIFAVLGYRQAGRDSDAKRILDLAAKRCNTSAWPYPVIRYLNREMTAESLLSGANNRDQMTEAQAYVGMDLLISGRHEEALEHLRWVSENGNRTFIEYTLARMELISQGYGMPGPSSP
jgi:tetratricopeptide (TPR) repeat protein